MNAVTQSPQTKGLDRRDSFASRAPVEMSLLCGGGGYLSTGQPVLVPGALQNRADICFHEYLIQVPRLAVWSHLNPEWLAGSALADMCMRISRMTGVPLCGSLWPAHCLFPLHPPSNSLGLPSLRSLHRLRGHNVQSLSAGLMLQ